ncbi:MAG: sodium:solute symporter [Planctomycetia bacterium]|nr:sodium:solute symporter [Planctomycetia bacterium]
MSEIYIFAQTGALTKLDWIVVVVYFMILFGLAWFVILKSKNTAKDYFLAGNSLGWFIVGASIFASNIGSEHLVGLAGSGCTDGVTLAHFELHAWCLLVLAWIFIPFYMRSNVYTMPEFLERRFSPNARWVLSIISLVAYVVTKVAVGIFAGGVVFKVLLPELSFAGLDSFWIGSILVILLTGLYTMLGGMRAVAYTEALQTVILILGSFLVMIYGLLALGKCDNGDGSLACGWKNLRAVCTNKEEGRDMFNLWKPLLPQGIEGTWRPVIEREKSVASTDSKFFSESGSMPTAESSLDSTRDNIADSVNNDEISAEKEGGYRNNSSENQSVTMSDLKQNDSSIAPKEGKIVRQAWYFKDKSQGSHYPWLGMLFCAPIIGLWYWCTDQYIVQRALSAKTQTEARRGSIFAAFLKLLPVFIFIIPGMICFALAYYGESALGSLITVSSEGQKMAMASESQGAFPLMVREVLPAGIRGIVVAGLLSALMSSLAGVFNACATLFTMDFYQKFRKNASQSQLVWIGRIATGIMILIGLSWIPIIQGKNGLYDYLQSVQGYLAPPIFAVFLLGVFWKRINAKGALTSLLLGFALGILRLGIDTYVTLGGELQEGSIFWIINNIYFQYYSLFIFFVCVLIMIIVSLLTKAPNYEEIRGLTFGTTSDEDRLHTRKSWSCWDIVASCVVVLAILCAYLYFIG